MWPYANYFVFAQVRNAGEHVINGKRVDPKKAIYIYFADLGRKMGKMGKMGIASAHWIRRNGPV